MIKKTTNTLQEILKPIEHHLKKVEDEILLNFTTGVQILDRSTSHLFQNGGKKIRASLIILSSGLKYEIPDKIIKVAAATEIAHGAALIHDDIIDQSLIRRGDIAIPQKWGNRSAVLIGDFLYTKALQLTLSNHDPKLISEMISVTSDMIRGELYQLEYSNIDLMNKEHYFKIIELKTAKFMAICTKIGAMLGDMTDDEINLLYQYGLNIGKAFQIIDDTLDFADNPEITGKNPGNDFLDGKITLPILQYLELSDDKEKEMTMKYSRFPDNDNWQIVKHKIKESGAIDYCVSIANDLRKKAIENLSSFTSSLYKDTMIDLAHFLVDRNY